VIVWASRLCLVAQPWCDPGSHQRGDQQRERADGDLYLRRNRAFLADARFAQGEHDHPADEEADAEAPHVVGDQQTHRAGSREDVSDGPYPRRIDTRDDSHQQHRPPHRQLSLSLRRGSHAHPPPPTQPLLLSVNRHHGLSPLRRVAARYRPASRRASLTRVRGPVRPWAPAPGAQAYVRLRSGGRFGAPKSRYLQRIRSGIEAQELFVRPLTPLSGIVSDRTASSLRMDGCPGEDRGHP
jgi:hypothetical protein